jgi:hypothetical protein
MSATKVVRPVVRSFTRRFVENAAAWVRRGGHAIIWDEKRRAHLVVPKPEHGKEDDDLGFWAMLDLGKDRWDVPENGALAGLAVVRVPRSCLDVVTRRAERDSIHEAPLRELELDCMACASCCKDNEVVLLDSDFERFEKAGRAELAKPPYAKTKDGKIVLKLRRDKRCRHLGDDNACAIYPIRPWACFAFPAGSECCLYSREDALGIFDGLPPQD